MSGPADPLASHCGHTDHHCQLGCLTRPLFICLPLSFPILPNFLEMFLLFTAMEYYSHPILVHKTCFLSGLLQNLQQGIGKHLLTSVYPQSPGYNWFPLWEGELSLAKE